MTDRDRSPDQVEGLLFGIHAVTAALQAEPCRLQRLWLLKSRSPNEERGVLAALAEARRVRIDWVDRSTLDRLAGGTKHQGVMARAQALTLLDESDLEASWDQFTNPLLLVLDGIMDPGNLGACLRSARGAGVDAVLLPKSRTAPLSAAAMKAASGAAEQLRLVTVSNLARRLKWLKAQGVWIIGAAGDGETVWHDAPWVRPAALVLGSEATGLRRLTRELCDYCVQIPLEGRVESLNVSVATGVLLFEALRQRRGQGL